MSISNHASIITAKLDGRRASETKKRTRDEVDDIDIDKRPFTIQPDTSDPFARPRSFTPLFHLSRAQLPLIYLDTTPCGPRIFSAYIHALEISHNGEGNAAVLVASDEKEKRMYAIERVERRMYALCRLGDWVKIRDLEAESKCVVRLDESQAKRRAAQTVERGQPWWTRAAVEMPAASEQQHAIPIALPSILDMRPHGPNLKDYQPAKAQASALMQDRHDRPLVDSSLEPSSATPEEMLEELARQYLAALYLSRTSLAYFTKGPLSRVRAAFAGHSLSATITDLIDFLHEAILPSSMMDRKYRDGVSGIVKELPIASLESSEQRTKSKRKRKWKAKRDKAGFLTDEKDYVERWWCECDHTDFGLGLGEATDVILRRRLPKIRNRETFLQIILVLEVMALEVSLPLQAGTTGGILPSGESKPYEEPLGELQIQAKTKKTKAKKKKDMTALLETLLDKLCIWHSLEGTSPPKKNDIAQQEWMDGSTDELKSFCIEVIVPFYTSRIPQYAAIVNKKLGGPSPRTPPVKRNPTAACRPGEPADRQPSEKKAREPLSRASSDTVNQKGKLPPSLYRSATDSGIFPHIKRETSEIPLYSVPVAKDPYSAPRKRTSLIHQIGLSRREVDLSAMSQATETKLRKKAEVEEKLREAITTLKKPNRALAVKEIADSTDESFAKVTARAKHSQAARAKNVRAGVNEQTVHVTATPKHFRAVKSTPRPLERTGLPHGSSGRTARVQSSSSKPTGQPYEAPPSLFTVPQTGHRSHRTANIEETPSRGFAKFMPPALARQPGTLESPIAQKNVVAADTPAAAAIQQTPSKAVRKILLPTTKTKARAEASATALRSSPGPSALVETSPNAGQPNDQDNSARSNRGGKQLPKSIYEALGWDEGYEDLA